MAAAAALQELGGIRKRKAGNDDAEDLLRDRLVQKKKKQVSCLLTSLLDGKAAMGRFPFRDSGSSDSRASCFRAATRAHAPAADTPPAPSRDKALTKQAGEGEQSESTAEAALRDKLVQRMKKFGKEPPAGGRAAGSEPKSAEKAPAASILSRLG